MSLRRIRSAALRGFTLVELLVAIAITAVVLLAIYFVFISNTNQYFRQEQIVQMRESMRFGMEYLKNDLRNAGRLSLANGTPSAFGEKGLCRKAADFTGVRLFDDENTNAVPDVLKGEENRIRPDRVRLLLDASGAVPLVTAQAFGSTVTLQAAAQQLTLESKELLDGKPDNLARFEAAYREGFYLRISEVDSDAFDLVPITNVSYNGGAPQIDLASATCLPGGCTGNCMVNAVKLVEYAIIDDPDDDTGLKTNLVRRLLDVGDQSVLEGSELIISEHVVNLQLWGTYDKRDPAAPTPSIPDDPDPKDDVGNWPEGIAQEAQRMNTRPERLRALNVLLATRTAREDPEFRIAPDRAAQPAERVASDRTWFELDTGDATGLARVATMVSEVSTPNLYRGL